MLEEDIKDIINLIMKRPIGEKRKGPRGVDNDCIKERRAAATKILGSIGYKRDDITQALEYGLSDDYFPVQLEASVSLLKLGVTKDEHFDILTKGQSSEDETLR